MSKPIYKYDRAYVRSVDLKYCDHETDRRYRLDVILRSGDSTKSVLLIMMNPSRANESVSDNTINRVIKYVSLNNSSGVLHGIGRVIFANLYVVYETYPEKVNVLAENRGWDFIKGVEQNAVFNNDRVILEAKNEAQVTIIGWGKGDIKGYEKRIREVEKIANGSNIYHVRELTEDGYPRHPRNWSYSWPLVEYV